MTGQGVNAIAIGSAAGMTGQAANTIVINATGTVVNTGTQNACYIAPIRDSSGTFMGGVNGNAIISYPLYYNSTSKEIQTRSTAGSFLCLNNNVAQTINSGGAGLTVQFPNTVRSVGNIPLTNVSSVFTNNSGQHLILNVSACWAFQNNGTGARAGWISHSGIPGLIGFVDINASPVAEPTAISINATICLLNGENFNLTAYQASGIQLSIQGGFYPFLNITLLN